MPNDGPLLICYDGSDNARSALDAAAALFAPRTALVVCYWEPFGPRNNRFGVDILELVQDPEEINAREEQLAWTTAEEGAEIATGAGLTAAAQAVKIQGPIDEAILVHADEIDAATIILGSRSRTGVRSLILGDIANEVAQRATRPVFLAPSPPLVEGRRDALRRDVESPTEIDLPR
jgi:nucleotide-binding universal stress UspA family protein